jgi:hypothetical protein
MPAIHFSFSKCRSYPGISAAWQYPDLPSSSPSRIHQWPRRSRDTVKFLLFEPPSDNNGLGSMLEVIALRIMHCVYECPWPPHFGKRFVWWEAQPIRIATSHDARPLSNPLRYVVSSISATKDVSVHVKKVKIKYYIILIKIYFITLNVRNLFSSHFCGLTSSYPS